MSIRDELREIQEAAVNRVRQEQEEAAAAKKALEIAEQAKLDEIATAAVTAAKFVRESATDGIVEINSYFPSAHIDEKLTHSDHSQVSMTVHINRNERVGVHVNYSDLNGVIIIVTAIAPGGEAYHNTRKVTSVAQLDSACQDWVEAELVQAYRAFSEKSQEIRVPQPTQTTYRGKQ